MIVTFMKKKFVDELHWIDEQEMLDFTALAQSAPGAIAVNTAILVGWKITGLRGMVVAVLGTIIPPIAVLSVVSMLYEIFISNVYVDLVLKGMQAGVAAVILDVVLGLGDAVLTSKSPYTFVIMILSFVVTFCFKVNVVYIIISAILLGVLREAFSYYTMVKKT